MRKERERACFVEVWCGNELTVHSERMAALTPLVLAVSSPLFPQPSGPSAQGRRQP